MKTLIAVLLLSTMSMAQAESITPLGVPAQIGEPSQEPKVYDIWCSPQSDTCEYEGKDIPRKDVYKYIPYVQTQWCDSMFCYKDSASDEVVGSNPARR